MFHAKVSGESAQSEARNTHGHSDNRCSDMFRNAFRRVLSHSAPRYLPGVLGSVGSIIEQEGHKIMENQQKGQSWPVSHGDV